MLRRQAGKVFLKTLGWKVTGPVPAPTDTAIFVGAPHTSGWDSALMLAVAWSNDLRIKFLIKTEVVDGPFGFFWKSVGAIPVERDQPGPLVDRLVKLADDEPGFQLVLTPEGTRKKVDYWKSGFYRLAYGAHIPVVLVTPEGSTKTVTFAEQFELTGDVSADMDRIRKFFADKNGIEPSKKTEPRLRAERDSDAAAELTGSRHRSADGSASE